MVAITDKRVTSFVTAVKKQFDAKVILFGSRADGSAFKESDYDLCIISKEFSKMELRERLQTVYAIMARKPFGADILAVTPLEFKRLSSSHTIYSDIKNKGVYV